MLADLHNSVIGAIENGESFDAFKKNIKPLLQKKGWWGKKKMTDPLTGKEVNAQLGSKKNYEAAVERSKKKALTFISMLK